MHLYDCIHKRRDTRHFKIDEPLPPEVLTRALQAADKAPSVGLSEPWRFRSIDEQEDRIRLHQHFLKCRTEAEASIPSEHRRQLHSTLKLEALLSAPTCLAVFCCTPQDYTLGASHDPRVFEWSVACAVQNLWLSLTADGYSLGWVSLLDPSYVGECLRAPDNWQSMGILCIGKPSTDYGGRPMLEQRGWAYRQKPS